MPRTGRPPKPLERHLSEGTYRKDRHAAAPTLAGGRRAVEVPRGLDVATRRAYEQILEGCASILDAADAAMVEACATMMARARIAGADVKKRGMLVPGRFDGADGQPTLVENPSVKQERDAWNSFRQFAEQLGIGPSARARLASLAVEGRDAVDELDGLGDLRAIGGAA